MKIVKYIFFLAVLALIGITVFIATQNGNYRLQKTTFIKVPKEIVFNYINDYRTWDQWFDLNSNSKINFVFPENTIGQGGSLSWNTANGYGSIETIFVKENDSISQKIEESNTRATSAITLKDSLGGTKLTWTVEGVADFYTKIEAAFSGGINSYIGSIYENSLNNIKAIVTKEIRNYSVTVIGEVKMDSIYFVKQTATAKVKDVHSKITPMLQTMQKFFNNGNLVMNGKPFVIYESRDVVAGTVTFSVCGPLKEQIFVSSPSDVSIGKLEPYTALKTVLKGDYSHRNKALKKARSFINQKKLIENTNLKTIDVYDISVAEDKSPSKWVTEILIPVIPTVATQPLLKPAPVARTLPRIEPPSPVSNTSVDEN